MVFKINIQNISTQVPDRYRDAKLKEIEAELLFYEFIAFSHLLKFGIQNQHPNYIHASDPDSYRDAKLKEIEAELRFYEAMPEWSLMFTNKKSHKLLAS